MAAHTSENRTPPEMMGSWVTFEFLSKQPNLNPTKPPINRCHRDSIRVTQNIGNNVNSFSKIDGCRLCKEPLQFNNKKTDTFKDG